jgi:uncharacterized protein YjiS (DUF1127 family)
MTTKYRLSASPRQSYDQVSIKDEKSPRERRLKMSKFLMPGSWSVMALIDYLEQLESRHQGRRLLAELDETQLRDIGLTRADAEQETDKLPWVA